MITLRTIQRNEWDKKIATRTEANFLQSWQWGDVQEQLGHRVLRQEIFDDDSSIGLVLGIIKDAKRGRYLEIAGGPLIDWDDPARIHAVLEALKALGREHACVFVRLRPQVQSNNELLKVFAVSGAKLSPMHVTADHTSIIDLTPDTDQLLDNMRQQTRYEVKRAPKREVMIEPTNDPAIIDQFYELQADTAARQGFIAPSKKYLSSIVEYFGDNVTIYKATKADQLLNLALVVRYGAEADYLEAASTIEARREPGAYGVVWRAIEDAKAAGISRFNLWGTAPPDSPGHRYAGVTTFKHGFGGDDIAYLAPHDLVISPLRYQITKLIESLRKKRRHL